MYINPSFLPKCTISLFCTNFVSRPTSSQNIFTHNDMMENRVAADVLFIYFDFPHTCIMNHLKQKGEKVF